MTPADEAAAILIRMLNTIIYPMGKRLKSEHEAEIRRACELLSADGTLQPLDDLPSSAPSSPASEYVPAAETDPSYRRWKEQRDAR